MNTSRILYKYLSPGRETYFTNELLRFTQPSCLNDPFECLPVVQIANLNKYLDDINERNRGRILLEFGHIPRIEKLIEKGEKEILKKHKKDPNVLLKFILKSYLSNANKTIGIFSLSRRWDSVLMWAHYTEAHSGFCVGYNSQHPFFRRQPDDPRDIGAVAPVAYETSRLTVQMDKANAIDYPLFYRKSKDWQYEEEERLIRKLKGAHSTIQAVPYNICLFNVPHAAIAEIIYGVNASDSLKSKILDIGKKLKISVWESVISRTTFNMERMQIR